LKVRLILRLKHYYSIHQGPNSVIKPALDRINNKLFKVTYIPLEIGFINIYIKWNGKDIVNSPFKAIVTNPGIVI
jgi:hypothetical protein